MSFFMHLIFSVVFAHAQSGYLGVNVGLSDATGPSTDKKVAAGFGGRAGFLFYDHVALGAMVHYYAVSEATQNVAMMPILAEILYYPHHDPFAANNYYVGATFGATQIVSKDGTGKHNDDATTFGVTAGYSIRLWDQFNIGPEVEYLFLYTHADDFKILNVHFSAKYFF
jgi:hypothetical protein